MLPFIMNITFLLVACGILFAGFISIKDLKQSKRFSLRFFLTLSVTILLIIGFRVISLNWFCDSRMERLRSEADYFLTILHNRSDRGRILDRNGVALAENSSEADGSTARVHPGGKAFAHIVGYSFPRYKLYSGLIQTGAEKYLSHDIYGIKSASSWRGGLRPAGRDVNLTLDSYLQETAFRALEGRRGSVVVMKPDTGEILVMVSSPSFDPDLIYRDNGLESSNAFENQAEINRAIQGLYPPGSTFKAVVATAALQEGKAGFIANSTTEGFKGPGMFRAVREHQDLSFGEIGISNAFKFSSNQYFAALGLELGQETILDYAEEFGFNKNIPWNSSTRLWSVSKSRYPLMDKTPLSPDELASSSFGQYGVTATPLQMCLVAAGIANGGVLMKPRIELDQHNRRWKRVMSHDSSRRLRILMSEVVGEIGDDTGTATLAQIEGLNVGGKTGTAQVDNARSHAWFICIAPVEDPVLVISVIVENAGYGGVFAVPIVKRILIEAKERGYFD